MTKLRILEIATWIVCGIIVLSVKTADIKYMKLEYFIVWIMLLWNLVVRMREGK